MGNAQRWGAAVGRHKVCPYKIAPGSTSVTSDAAGNSVAELRYRAFGQTRFALGSTPTSLRFTGQQQAPELGLYDYGARFFDPALGRFIQPDSLVPQPGNPLAWDRYAYANNNPVKYVDPDGHCALLVTAVTGLAIAAVVDYGYQVYSNVQSGQNFNEALWNVDVAEIAGAAVAGGFAGLTLGAGTAILATIGGAAATTGIKAVPVAAISGGIGNAVGGQLGALTEAGIQQINNSEFNTDQFYDDAFNAGFLNSDEFIWDIGTGAILGATGQALSNMTVQSTAVKYRFYDQFKDIEGNLIKVPQKPSVSFPGEVSKPVIKGVSSGVMQNISNWGQEIITQGFDQYRSIQQYQQYNWK